jgi:hypothetical protein
MLVKKEVTKEALRRLEFLARLQFPACAVFAPLTYSLHAAESFLKK